MYLGKRMITNNKKDLYFTVLEIALIVIAFLAVTWQFRAFYRDDAYIHMRYAKNLLTTGGFEYNIGQPSFGTSAPFFTILLAGTGFILRYNWLLASKLLCIFGHAATVALFYTTLKKSINPPQTTRLTFLYKRYAFLVTLFMLCTPSAARWLQDGMETSLATLFAMLATLSSIYLYTKSPANILKYILPAIACALPGILRIDCIPISVCAILVMFLVHRNAGKVGAAFICGTMLCTSYLIIYMLLGSFTPDTIYAKSSSFTLLWPVFGFIGPMLGMSPLWVLPGIIGIILIYKAFITGSRERIHILIIVGLSLCPIIAQIAAGTMAGQPVQGARYFLPALVFAWGMLSLAPIHEKDNAKIIRANIYAQVTFVIMAIIHCFILWPKFATLSDPKHRVCIMPIQCKNKDILIGCVDIGVIGWYSGARIFDLCGLVNGSTLAKMKLKERISATIDCMGPPDAFILTSPCSKQFRDNNGNLTISSDKYGIIVYSNTEHKVFCDSNLQRTDAWYTLWLPTKSRH